MVLSGWGRRVYLGVVSNTLQFLESSTITNAACASALSEVDYSVYPNQICTFTRSGQGVCIGDYGSPLVINDVLVGVVSWGYHCGIGSPDVYTRVSSYIDWIQANAT